MTCAQSELLVRGRRQEPTRRIVKGGTTLGEACALRGLACESGGAKCGIGYGHCGTDCDSGSRTSKSGNFAASAHLRTEKDTMLNRRSGQRRGAAIAAVALVLMLAAPELVPAAGAVIANSGNVAVSMVSPRAGPHVRHHRGQVKKTHRKVVRKPLARPTTTTVATTSTTRPYGAAQGTLRRPVRRAPTRTKLRAGALNAKPVSSKHSSSTVTKLLAILALLSLIALAFALIGTGFGKRPRPTRRGGAHRIEPIVRHD